MSVLHEMFIKIKSSFEGENSFSKASDGFKNVSREMVNLKQSQDKIKNLEVQIKGFEKIQNQIQNTKFKNETLTKQIEEFKTSLSSVSQGSTEYKEIEKAIQSLEREQTKLNIQNRKLETASKSAESQLKDEGISTKNLSSEKIKLANKSRDLKGDIDKLTNSQKKNESQTKQNDSSFGKLGGSLKGLAIGMAGMFGIAEIKQYGSEAIALANEKIKAETDLQAMLTNTKNLHGDTTAINKASNMLKDYANQLETVGVIGDETIIAGQAQLATFQLMPSTIKKLTTGMTDMLAKNKGMNATQEDAAGLANLFGKVMTGNVGSLSKYGVTLSENQKKVLKLGTEMERASMLAQILSENYGGANEALGKTDEGKMVIMRAELEGIKEEFGKGLLPLQVKFFEIFKGQGPNISKILQGALDVAGKFFSIFQNNHPEKIFGLVYDSGILVLDVIGKITVGATSFIDWMKKGSDGAVIFGGVVWGLATAVGLYTTAIKIHHGWTKLVAGAQVLWNAAMNLSPMGIFLTVLTGIGVGLVYAYKHSETFRNVLHNLWEKVKKLIEPLKTAAEWVGKLFSGGDKTKNININTKTTTSGTGTPYTPYTGYDTSKFQKKALGGVSNRPAIFGEAGPEIAIPLNKTQRSKGLLSYANNIVNGDKKQNSFLQSGVDKSNPITVVVNVTVQGIVESIDKAKQIGQQIGNSAKATLEEQLNQLSKDKGRLSLE